MASSSSTAVALTSRNRKHIGYNNHRFYLGEFKNARSLEVSIEYARSNGIGKLLLKHERRMPEKQVLTVVAEARRLVKEADLINAADRIVTVNTRITNDVDDAEDRDSGKPRGFAFVTMGAANAEQACMKVNGSEVDGRTLRVNEAQPKGSAPPRGGYGAGGGGYGGAGGYDERGGYGGGTNGGGGELFYFLSVSFLKTFP